MTLVIRYRCDGIVSPGELDLVVVIEVHMVIQLLENLRVYKVLV